MKTIKKLLLGLLLLIFIQPSEIIAQEKEEFKPVYLAITTAHRSADAGVDFSDWLKTEQEYFEKVTKKNDLIIGSGYYFHYFTADDSEIKIVNVYKTWNDIDEAGDVDDKLIKEGWPNEDERKAFFEKRRSYYSPVHSDEIYQSFPMTKELKTESKKPLIYYVKNNQRGSGDGSGFKEYFDNVTMKNSFIKGYYTHGHFWGANSLDANEVFVFDKFGDIEKMFDESQKLIEAHWPDKDKRKEFLKGYSKIFAGHGDYIYQNVPELAK